MGIVAPASFQIAVGIAAALGVVCLALAVLALDRHFAFRRMRAAERELPRPLQQHQRGRLSVDPRRAHDQRQPRPRPVERLRQRRGDARRGQRHRRRVVCRSDPTRRAPRDSRRERQGRRTSSPRSIATRRANGSGSRRARGWCATDGPAIRSSTTARCARSPRRSAASSCRRATTRSRPSSPAASIRCACDRMVRCRCPMLSSGLTDLYGVTPEEVMRDPSGSCALVHPDDRAAVVEFVRATRRAP